MGVVNLVSMTLFCFTMLVSTKQCVEPESTNVFKTKGEDESEEEAERRRTRDEEIDAAANLGERETKETSGFRPVRRASPDELVASSFLDQRLSSWPWRR